MSRNQLSIIVNLNPMQSPQSCHWNKNCIRSIPELSKIVICLIANALYDLYIMKKYISKIKNNVMSVKWKLWILKQTKKGISGISLSNVVWWFSIIWMIISCYILLGFSYTVLYKDTHYLWCGTTGMS